jgi:FAD/FMN-containing dehydrogenase
MMNRRRFCQGTALACLASTYPPLLHAVNADTSIPAVSLDGKDIELEAAAVRELGGAFDGPLLLSGHPQYESARRIWNGMHDKHPALIARCTGSEDIRHAVTFARERNLLVAVRGGGHSWPGKSVCEGGMMIDLAPMNQVSVDRERRTANASGGALLAHLDAASLQHGLVTTAGVVSHTGVGGFTLGGGFGRLNRKYGLAIDNLVAAEIITADGAVRRISSEQEPDLFWAIRGGGGNFGVVSGFEFQLHPFERKVLSGPIVWPVEQAREVLDFYIDWYLDLSDELYVGPTMASTPDGTPIILMEVVYAGKPVEGERELEPLRKIGKPLEDGVKVQDYTMMQTWEDATFHHGIRSYAKNGMVREMTPALVKDLIDAYVPDTRLAFFTHTAGGAVKRVGELDTAFPHRKAETMLIVAGVWTDPAEDEEAISLARNWFGQLAAHTGGYYDNIEFEGDDRAAGNYGPAYQRLARIKGRYDPDNLFRLNSNITPLT